MALKDSSASLLLYGDYDREGVQKIFEPEAAFTPGAGSWGLSGAITVPGTFRSYIFFVSFGQSNGGHSFDEGIDRDGFLRWQSQPKQRLDQKRIQNWIGHDHSEDAIHLFLRTSLIRGGRPAPFTYLGELEYVAHDPEKESPVHFLWRLRTWPIPPDVIERMQLVIDHRTPDAWEAVRGPQSQPTKSSGIQEVARPTKTTAAAKKEPNPPLFQPRLDINFQQKSARAIEIGALGEDLVLKYEKERLIELGRSDLADKIVHVSKERGDGAGYDILSYMPDGSEMYIEVKTTVLGQRTDFMMSPNEVAFAKSKPNQYRLYRLYSLNETIGSAEFFVLKADFLESYTLQPTGFRVSGF